MSKVLAVDLADRILQLEADDGRIQYGVLDSSLWHKRGDTGPSLAEQMIVRGCKWRPSDRSKGSRVAGKNEIHRRLQVDEFTQEPRMVVFNNCTNLISQLPSLPLDKKNPEDVDTNAMDHMYDALRYGIMTRPRSSIWDYNPVNQRTGFQVADPESSMFSSFVDKNMTQFSSLYMMFSQSPEFTEACRVAGTATKVTEAQGKSSMCSIL